MNHNIIVGIGDMAIGKEKDILVTYALGSCVGICLYDKECKIGGMSHILLPDSNTNLGDKEICKYADTALPELVKKLYRAGARSGRLWAKIAGGAKMFGKRKSPIFRSDIGSSNIQAVKAALKKLNIIIIDQEVGGNCGRTLFFDLADGAVKVNTANKTVRIM